MPIKYPVELNATNKRSDVITIQKLLVKQGFSLKIDGLCGNKTINSIREFQKRLMIYPNSYVDINGKTLRFLNSNKMTTLNNSNFHSVGIGRKFDVTTLRLSQSGINLLKNYESLRLKIYDDQTGKEISHYIKGATIGYGYLIRNTSEFEEYKNGISISQAELLFSKVLVTHENAVKKYVKVNLTQSQFDALTIICYNNGIGNNSRGFGGSTVVKITNGESSENLDLAWKAWNKSQGSISMGLIKRRETELTIYYKVNYTRS
ncbi:glycoside hydrolase family protein [Rosenbergiella epipactidis]|uniref:glycoside hydrolase family protein n=1 Tax=Rosenbergiella epipactidis TaxID=1544694 RepID=UPI001F4DF75A|nr:glycoside hydrolase family protein [Rosenbergiella epipactidis]